MVWPANGGCTTPPPPGHRCRFLGRGVFVNPAGALPATSTTAMGLLGFGPSLWQRGNRPGTFLGCGFDVFQMLPDLAIAPKASNTHTCLRPDAHQGAERRSCFLGSFKQANTKLKLNATTLTRCGPSKTKTNLTVQSSKMKQCCMKMQQYAKSEWSHKQQGTHSEAQGGQQAKEVAARQRTIQTQAPNRQTQKAGTSSDCADCTSTQAD